MGLSRGVLCLIGYDNRLVTLLYLDKCVALGGRDKERERESGLCVFLEKNKESLSLIRRLFCTCSLLCFSTVVKEFWLAASADCVTSSHRRRSEEKVSK